jgi:hypothetical protein
VAAAVPAIKAVSPQTERYARVCEEHGQLLVDLDCPRGHTVEHWAALDTARGVLYAWATPDAIWIADTECGQALAAMSEPGARKRLDRHRDGVHSKVEKQIRAARKVYRGSIGEATLHTRIWSRDHQGNARAAE